MEIKLSIGLEIWMDKIYYYSMFFKNQINYLISNDFHLDIILLYICLKFSHSLC